MNLRFILLGYFVILAATTVTIHGAFVLESTSGNEQSVSVYAAVVKFTGNPLNFNPIEAPVIVINDNFPRSYTPTENATQCPLCQGRIVLTPWSFDVYHRIVAYIQQGAVAILLGGRFGREGIGLSEYRWVGTVQNQTALGFVPIAETSRAEFERLLATFPNASTDALGRLTDQDGISPWRQLLSSWYWFLITIVMACIGAGNAAFAVIRLIQHWKGRGFMFWELPQICLALEFVGCVLRFLYWSIDPMNMRNLMSFLANGVFRTWSLPFSLCSQLLLIFFWLETITNSRLEFTMNLTRFRIPAIILCIILFSIEIASSILGTISVGTGDLAIINTVVYMVVSVGLSIFYTSVATKILLQLRRMASSAGSGSGSSGSVGSNGRSQKLTIRTPNSKIVVWNTTVRLLVSGLCLIGIVVVAIFTVSPWFLRQETAMAWIWLTVHILLHVRAIATVLALRRTYKRSITRQKTTSQSDKGPTAATSVMTDKTRSKSSVTGMVGSSTSAEVSSALDEGNEQPDSDSDSEESSDVISSSSSDDKKSSSEEV